MFFAGRPSDIAEYIKPQVGSDGPCRHSLLVPTPHSRRDRYVIGTHDQFHRFLERMIPPAVQRWADVPFAVRCPVSYRLSLRGGQKYCSSGMIEHSPNLQHGRGHQDGPTAVRAATRVPSAPPRNLRLKRSASGRGQRDTEHRARRTLSKFVEDRVREIKPFHAAVRQQQAVKLLGELPNATCASP
jgi:hypothetical protein